MKLNYSLSELSSIMKSDPTLLDNQTVQTIYYDSRKIHSSKDGLSKNGLFICLRGDRRDGHEFIEDAYQKGIRNFVVDHTFHGEVPNDVSVLRVENTLVALQKLAKFHRLRFSYPVIGITGSVGKTILKEWLYELLRTEFHIVRSPKSFNSQLGVALSLLEMSDEYNLAIIEAGISQPNEMKTLEDMIRPTIGILTTIGTAHLQNFDSEAALFHEKAILFQNARMVLSGDEKYTLNTDFSQKTIHINDLSSWKKNYYPLIRLASEIVFRLTGNLPTPAALNQLPQIAMRMEVFEGIQNTTIINDAYNLDLDAFKQSLDFLISSNNRSKAVLLIVANHVDSKMKSSIENLIQDYPIDFYQWIHKIDAFPIHQFSDASILIKGFRDSNGQKLAQKFKLLKHETIVEINMEALRNNLDFVRSKVKPTTKILAMVKASAYGTDALKIAPFLERNNIDYLGVAYGDEGVALRNIGVKTPILVMNAEPFSYENIIQHRLEPALFSHKSLEEFIKTLINLGIENYPIHLTFDTGMHRLGFHPDETNRVLETILSQPEISVQGIYTHLADADNFDSDDYSNRQLTLFDSIISTFRKNLTYPFLAHVLNSEGILKFTDHQYDMVRMGISLYGYVSNTKFKKSIQPVVSWKTIISQIRTLPKGEKISYNGRYTTDEVSKIAVIPVGYADGLKRIYNQNKEGFVFIHHQRCAIVGTICMDMCMVNVTNIACNEGDEVILIGEEQSLEDVAEQMKTIPYEVLTSISRRVHRVYLNER